MLFDKKFAYIALGGVLALGLVFGGAALFAQDEVDTNPAPETTQDEEADEVSPPYMPHRGGRFERGPGIAMGDGLSDLADALGVTVEELQAAYQEAHAAILDQAVADGRLTQEQADALKERGLPMGGGMGRHGAFLGEGDYESYLAEALGISVESLEEAFDQVQADHLAAMVEAGVITQEQADLMAARHAVQEYVDREGLNAAVRSAYEAAVAQALEEGAITQAQADALLSNLDNFGGFGMGPGIGQGMGPGGFGGRGFHGGGRGSHMGPGTPGMFPGMGQGLTDTTSGA